jgi:hypothetical protein
MTNAAAGPPTDNTPEIEATVVLPKIPSIADKDKPNAAIIRVNT